jgi:hypothetical protein
MTERNAVLEFVGIDPSKRRDGYSYEGVETFFLEVILDGQRYRIDVGDIGVNMSDGKPRRGVHINYPLGAERGEYSLNALNIVNVGEEPLPSR